LTLATVVLFLFSETFIANFSIRCGGRLRPPNA
jgi:hypothetical protein